MEPARPVRPPLRWSSGPATTPDPTGGSPGTQLRTPPLVPDATATDWRYTGSLVPPWTELDFHVGSARAGATIQIASENITDAGYRHLRDHVENDRHTRDFTRDDDIASPGRTTDGER